MKKICAGFFQGILGCLFATALTTSAGVFTDLHDFSNGNPSDATFPNGVLLNNGLLYGAAAQGGAFNNGMVFTLATNGVGGISSLHDFAGAPVDGGSPNELLLVNNEIYGTTYVGGTNSSGTIFKMNVNRSGYVILRSFTNSPDPQFPVAGLILNDATLYGASLNGGAFGQGAIFKVDTNGANFVVLHDFTNSPDGANAQARLVLNGATLYGTTSAGGSNNLGTAFKLSTNGTAYSVIYTFSNAPAAAAPYAELTFSGNQLYGVSSLGGISNSGAVFQLSTNGALTIIHSFTNSEGFSPQGGLTAANNLLYGTTLSRGTGNGGTVFQVVTNGANFTVLKNFTNTINGANPKGRLALDGKTLYGIANASGPNSGGTAFSLLLSPFINSQPQGLTVTNGSPASFTVTASDEFAPSYQWFFNTSTLLGGQTGATLNFGSTATNNTGAYSVVVSDNAGSVTSSPATLTVLAVPGITTQPQSINVNSGNSALFTVTAVSSSGAPTYQWYFNTNTLLIGQTGSSYNIPVATNNNAGTYTVTVANNIGTVTSTPAVLTISSPAPNITVQPQSRTVTNGNATTFTVTATTASGTLVYQWYFNTNTVISGQTNSAYTIPVTLTNNAGTFTVVVGNGFNTTTSSPAVLTVSLNSKPIIYSQPQDTITTNGFNATFTVIAVGSNTLSYQWYSNSVNTAIGLPAVGKNTSVLTFTGIGRHYNATYWTAVVTNALGKATSNPAFLTVVSEPLIISNPQPATVFVGNPATFTVVALNAMTYQWYSNSVNTSIGKPLTGQAGSTYSFTSTTNSSGKYYSVVITNTFGNTTSTPALLTVSSLPYITLQPIDTVLSNSSSITFTSTAAGPGTLVYQWLYQTNLLVAGATNTTLILSNSSPLGMYSMKVTNSFGAATSTPAMFSIASLPAPIITLQPLSATITNGSSITFTSAATGTGSLGYQWLYQTNILISGATSTSLMIPTANQPGTYSMKVTDNNGTATSSPALLTVVGRPVLISSAFDPVSGSYAFTYVNLAGSTNRLWTTTNLANTTAWQALATNFMATNGIWQFTDTNTARTNAIRFYRFSTP